MCSLHKVVCNSAGCLLLQQAMEKELEEAEHDVNCLSAAVEDDERLLNSVSNACQQLVISIQSLYLMFIV